MQICFATNNKHKLLEVVNAVQDKVRIVSLSELSVTDDLPETQNTFQGNALQKAQFVFDHYQIPCFADDSGLVVDALQGAPGVFSARYAGLQRNDQDNINLLLEKLKSEIHRSARFVTVIALVGFGQPNFFEGSIEGEITTQRIGSGGFGYDPVFKPLGRNKTFAQMSLEEKNQLSHRAIAVRKLVDYLKTLPI
jgi:XTP/dITP diphosphohydrolase